MAKIVHYLNQFYAQIGGEEQAGQEALFVPEPLGAGVLIRDALAKHRVEYATIVCGDNYFHEQEELAFASIRRFLDDFSPDILIAGPAFNAGRYGLACSKVCSFAREQWRIPAITGMYGENPGTREVGRHVWVIETGPSVASMKSVIGHFVELLSLLLREDTAGIKSFKEEFCLRIPRRFTIETGQPDFVRAGDLLVAKLENKPFESEIPLVETKPHTIPAPIRDLKNATLALVTEGGLVPKGNPDRLESSRGSKYLKYSVAGRDGFEAGQFEAMHTGYDTSTVNKDPDRIVPLDAMRVLEKRGKYSKLHEYYFVTTGTGASPTRMEEIGADIGRELIDSGIQGVVLTSTWGTGTRSGATIGKQIEQKGIPVVLITCLANVATQVGIGRMLGGSKFHYPLGNPDLPPDQELGWRVGLIERALKALQTEVERPTVF
jgi:betaine reductase